MFAWLSGEPAAPKEHDHDTHMCLADAFTSAFTAAISLSSSVLETAGSLRDRAIEATLIQVVNSFCAEHFTIPETGIEIHMDKGVFIIQEMFLTKATGRKISAAFAENGLPLRVVAAKVSHIEISNFFASDLIDGKIDQPLGFSIQGITLILRTTTVLPDPTTAEEPAEPDTDTKAEKKENEDDQNSMVNSILCNFDVSPAASQLLHRSHTATTIATPYIRCLNCN
jgi:hypothetical protein